MTARLEAHSAETVASGEDVRLRGVQQVRALWNLTGMQGPAAVVFFLPPYYPHVRPAVDSPFARAVQATADEYGAVVRRFYPYISDASYLSLRDAGDVSALRRNMPLWSDTDRPDRYSLPLDLMASLNLDVANVGVWGYGAHRRTERAYIPYSCGVVPRMIVDLVDRLLPS
ncbi:MAG: hypothetical protein WKH64_17460 [Chloroflexia bacterium]